MSALVACEQSRETLFLQENIVAIKTHSAAVIGSLENRSSVLI